MPSNNTTKKKSILLSCLGGCGKNNFKGTLYKFRDGRTSKITSQGLANHLSNHRDAEQCLSFYEEHSLVSYKKRGYRYHYIFSEAALHFDQCPRLLQQPSSVVVAPRASSQPPQAPLYSPTQLGLIPRDMPTTNRRRISSMTIRNSQLLNRQTTYNPFQSVISRTSIEGALARRAAQDNNITDSTTQEGHQQPGDDIHQEQEPPPPPQDQEYPPPPEPQQEDQTMLASSPMVWEHLNSPDANTARLDPRLSTEVKLLNIITRYRMPLCAFREIFQWAITADNQPGFHFQPLLHSRTRNTVLNDIRSRLNLPNEGNEFQPRLVPWLPDNIPIEVHVRPIDLCIASLLNNPNLAKEENLYFLNSTNPLKREPEEGEEVDAFSELQHAYWFTETGKVKCKEGSNEILVPIILYIDGIVCDEYGRLLVTPLNMTLGIFSVETRKKPEAWETIYFHPDPSLMSSEQRHSAQSTDHLQNLHNGLRAALESVEKACNSEEGMNWPNLPWNGRKWNVQMKFAIAYVIGDTEMHDKLCGRYGSRTGGVKKLCRHCDCSTKHSVTPLAQPRTCFWKPEDFQSSKEPSYFKSVSHHCIDNAFHRLDFGCNTHNIHFATPGECLHMHQLGAARRCLESFTTLLSMSHDQRRGNRKQAKDDIRFIAKSMGGLLSRQSERDFPRTNFKVDILNPKNKEGNHFAGILLSLLLALMSTKGKSTLSNNAFLGAETLEGYINTIELILCMEEFLKKGRLKKNKLKALEKMIVHFINKINTNCQRGGMGTRLIKNHLYFHLPDYIRMWGPPAGWDSAPNESHHKTQIKAPSKNTQKNARTLIQQIATRQNELRILRRAAQTMEADASTPEKKRDGISGSKFRIYRDGNSGQGKMEWCNLKNANSPCHPESVLDYIAVHLLSIGNDNQNHNNPEYVDGFTEHNRVCGESNTRLKFRASPSYRSDSGQLANVWYDWAEFKFVNHRDREEFLPCRIHCFLDLSSWIEFEEALYAVVQVFENEPRAHPSSNIVSTGELNRSLQLVPCNAISDSCAVVQDTGNPSGNVFFVVANRLSWLAIFEQTMERIDQEYPLIQTLREEGLPYDNENDDREDMEQEDQDDKEEEADEEEEDNEEDEEEEDSYEEENYEEENNE